MLISQKLIDVAVDAGCNTVKFQKRDINLVYTKFLDSHRESPWEIPKTEIKLKEMDYIMNM